MLKFWIKADHIESWNSSKSWQGVRVHLREVKTEPEAGPVFGAVNKRHPPHSRNSQAAGKAFNFLYLVRLGSGVLLFKY